VVPVPEMKSEETEDEEREKIRDRIFKLKSLF